MSFSGDYNGLAERAAVKAFNFSFQPIKELAEILRTDRKVIILTYSVSCNLDYLQNVFDIRSYDVTVIVNEKYDYAAKLMKERWPDLKIYLSPNVHAKMMLAEPNLTYLTSVNLGFSKTTMETTVAIESRSVYGHFLDEIDTKDMMNPAKEVRI